MRCGMQKAGLVTKKVKASEVVDEMRAVLTQVKNTGESFPRP